MDFDSSLLNGRFLLHYQVWARMFYNRKVKVNAYFSVSTPFYY